VQNPLSCAWARELDSDLNGLSRVHGAQLVVSVIELDELGATGAMTGNLLGAALSEKAIRSRWLETLELGEVIGAVADDLATLALDGVVDAVRYPPH